MKRKETYATTGSRMTVRFFGGWDFVAADAQSGCPRRGRLHQGRADGRRPEERAGRQVADLPGRGAQGSDLRQPRPHPDRQGLGRREGARQEKVYDVAWVAATASPAPTASCRAVGNTVDVPNATWTNTIGASELIAVWKDPAFDPTLRAVYYARVIEIPTPRWTAYDAKRFNIKMAPEVPMTTTERAYTSPIWYTP